MHLGGNRGTISLLCIKQLMLQTLNIDLGKVCAPAFDFGRGRYSFLGHAFAYYFNEVVKSAQKQRKSLDRVLTELVLAGITAHPVKSKLLFWFSATNELLFLTVSDVRHKLHPMWMCALAGYMECGSDYVHPNARPFLYWDGGNLTRVYPPPGEREPGQTYLCDLGALMGYNVGWGDEGAVERTRMADPEFTVYSIVPEQPEEVVTVGKRKCVLSHAFYALTMPRVPAEDIAEDEYAD